MQQISPQYEFAVIGLSAVTHNIRGKDLRIKMNEQ
jgi:hypothetical protein